MKRSKLIFIIPLILFLAACSKDNDNNQQEGKAILSVKLVDFPGTYDAVNIDVQRLRAKLDEQWMEFTLESPGVYNLRDFINGNTLLLIGDTALDPATISEIRLILGDNNSVEVDGASYDMQTPSGQSSGYKVKMDPQVMEPGGLYRLVIDFDVSKSVHQTGNGKYMLNPVVRGYLESAVGGIAGAITPIGAAGYVEAHNSSDTAGTFIDPVNGQFLISTLLPGLYDIAFIANTGYGDTTVTGITVEAGQITQMGTVPIPVR